VLDSPFTGLIVGVVIGLVLWALIIGLLLWFWRSW
jgi:hypothetical protein